MRRQAQAIRALLGMRLAGYGLVGTVACRPVPLAIALLAVVLIRARLARSPGGRSDTSSRWSRPWEPAYAAASDAVRATEFRQGIVDPAEASRARMLWIARDAAVATREVAMIGQAILAATSLVLLARGRERQS